MPRYDYECSSCGYTFERRQRFEDDPVAACPDCEGTSRRVFHSVPILFKGSGFYCTDNASARRSDQDSPNGDSPDKSEAKAKPQTEAKAETPAQTPTATPSKDAD